jgi:hypothetical protein
LHTTDFPGPSLSALVRVHAPDHIIAQLGGTFAPYTTMASVSAPHRINPPGSTFARGELYLWWTPTWPNNRVPSPGRRAVVRTVLTLAVRMRTEARAQAALQGGELPFFMASGVWLMVLGFVKHDHHML